MRFPWLHKLRMRTKVITVAVLVLLLAGASIFTVLYSTGKLGTRADAIMKTVTVTGNFSEVASSTTTTPGPPGLPGVQTAPPVKNGKVTISYGDKSVQTTTDAKGNYRAVVTVNTSDPPQPPRFHSKYHTRLSAWRRQFIFSSRA